MAWWYEAKKFVEHATAISMDALHVLVGLVLLLVLALVLGRSVSDWRPWLALLALALVNEAIDLSVEYWPSPGMQFGEGAKDVLLTMLLPTLLALGVRYLPELFQPSDGMLPPGA